MNDAELRAQSLLMEARRLVDDASTTLDMDGWVSGAARALIGYRLTEARLQLTYAASDLELR